MWSSFELSHQEINQADWYLCCCCSCSIKLCPVALWFQTIALQASLSPTISQSLLKFTSIESVMLSNHLILWHPTLLLPSVFPIIRVFSNELALHIWKAKYWSFSFSNSPSNEYSGLISFILTGLISLQSKRLSRVFSNTRIWKHQLFGAQLSSWSNSHICTWLLEKPQLWLYGPLLAKLLQNLFLICCLNLS